MLAVSGCTTTAVQPYRPAGESAQWQIVGTYHEVTDRATLTIDGAPVIDGTLSHWDGSGTLSGTHQGRPVTMSCAGDYHPKTCTVTVAGELAATLKL